MTDELSWGHIEDKGYEAYISIRVLPGKWDKENPNLIEIPRPVARRFLIPIINSKNRPYFKLRISARKLVEEVFFRILMVD